MYPFNYRTGHTRRYLAIVHEIEHHVRRLCRDLPTSQEDHTLAASRAVTGLSHGMSSYVGFNSAFVSRSSSIFPKVFFLFSCNSVGLLPRYSTTSELTGTLVSLL